VRDNVKFFRAIRQIMAYSLWRLWSPFSYSRQPDTSLHCQTMDTRYNTRILHRAVCMQLQ